jgi:hypothetical protein
VLTLPFPLVNTMILKVPIPSSLCEKPLTFCPAFRRARFLMLSGGWLWVKPLSTATAALSLCFLDSRHPRSVLEQKSYGENKETAAASAVD